VKWTREKTALVPVYRSGEYKIEKFDGLMRGSPVWWVLTLPGGVEYQRKHLSVVKRIAERHARAIASEEGRL
jgi:hypothetical protein